MTNSLDVDGQDKAVCDGNAKKKEKCSTGRRQRGGQESKQQPEPETRSQKQSGAGGIREQFLFVCMLFDIPAVFVHAARAYNRDKDGGGSRKAETAFIFCSFSQQKEHARFVTRNIITVTGLGTRAPKRAVKQA